MEYNLVTLVKVREPTSKLSEGGFLYETDECIHFHP